jgi:hypothetical protein
MREAMLTSYPQFGAGVFIGGMEGVEREYEGSDRYILLPTYSRPRRPARQPS